MSHINCILYKVQDRLELSSGNFPQGMVLPAVGPATLREGLYCTVLSNEGLQLVGLYLNNIAL